MILLTNSLRPPPPGESDLSPWIVTSCCPSVMYDLNQDSEESVYSDEALTTRATNLSVVFTYCQVVKCYIIIYKPSERALSVLASGFRH